MRRRRLVLTLEWIACILDAKRFPSIMEEERVAQDGMFSPVAWMSINPWYFESITLPDRTRTSSLLIEWAKAYHHVDLSLDIQSNST